jgi:anti-sigma factor RsiW
MSQRQHIPQTQLALYSRGDVGFWRRKLVERHLDRCEECAAAALEFVRLQESLSRSADVMPAALDGSGWQSLASEMSANIRLGLSAGECVSFVERPSRVALVTPPRLSLALAGLTVLAVLLAMENPVLHHAAVPAQAGLSNTLPTLEASGDETMVSSGDRGLSVPAPAGSNVIRTVSAHGAVRSRYVDDTGVTIVNVYAE